MSINPELQGRSYPASEPYQVGVKRSASLPAP